jgi:hypothetical protein
MSFATRFTRSIAQVGSAGALARRRTLFKITASLLVSGLLAAPALAPAGDRDDDRWIGTWTASPQSPEPPIIVPTPVQFDNQTIRQVVRTSIGGRKVRVRRGKQECSERDGKSETPSLSIGAIGREPARSKALNRLRSKSVPSRFDTR